EPAKRDRLVETERPDPFFERTLERAVSDQVEPERDPTLPEDGGGLEQELGPFLRHEPPYEEYDRRLLRIRSWVPVRIARTKIARVDSVIGESDVARHEGAGVPPGNIAEQISVVFRAREREPGA